MSEDKRNELRKVANEFLESLKDEVDSCVLLCDVDRLDGLISVVDMYLGYRLLRSLREKGLSKEIQELCDKAGSISQSKTKREK